MAHITPGAGAPGVASGTGANVEPTAATILLSTRVTGDTNDRFTIGADGKMSWGPGNGATDTFLDRRAGGVLETPNSFGAQIGLYAQIGSATQVFAGNAGPSGASGISFQGGEAGSNLYRSAAGTLKSDGALVIANTVSGSAEVQAYVGQSYITKLSTAYDGASFWPRVAMGTTNSLIFVTGAPIAGLGANGDIAFRSDGGSLTTIYQRRAGAWVGIV